jgi:hypothetical protein
MIIAACGADQYAAKPGQYSFTLCLLKALPVLTNNFETPVLVVDLQMYIDSMMKQNPNPWFPQDTRFEKFSGTGDVWLARIQKSNSRMVESNRTISTDDQDRGRKKSETSRDEGYGS